MSKAGEASSPAIPGSGETSSLLLRFTRLGIAGDSKPEHQQRKTRKTGPGKESFSCRKRRLLILKYTYYLVVLSPLLVKNN